MASSISPSAATYPHPAFLIGYSNFPFAAGPAYTPYPPPASPYAATYPYPPPSSTHTPAPPVFSPNWPAWPPHSPDPSPSTAPSTTKGERMTLRDGGVLQSEKSSSAVHPAKPVTCQDGDLGKGSNTSGAPIHGLHKHRGHGTFSKANASTTHRFFMEDEVAVQVVADKRVPAKNTTCHGRQRKHLNLHARLDEQQARNRTAINSLQGQLAKLELMASQMATAMSMQITEVPTTESSPTVASAPSTSPATTPLRSSDTGAAASSSSPFGASFAVPTRSSASTLPAAPAYVASQVFAEMPQSSGFHNLNTESVIRADGTEHSFSGHHNPIQSPCQSTLSEQNLGPVFDVYDDDMDGCSTEFFDVFLGTPEQQKNDQFANCFPDAYLNAFSEDTPARASHAYYVDTKGRTDQSVHVFASPPEQPPYEEEQHESEQPPSCFSIPSQNAPEVVSDYAFPENVDVFVPRYIQFRQGQCIRQVIESVYTPGSARRDVQLLNDCKWNVLLTEESREVWDPGASALLQQPRDSRWSMLVTHEEVKEWDPGEQTVPGSILNRDIFCVQYYTTHVLLVRPASCRESTENRLADQKLMVNTSTKVAALTWYNSLPGTLFILLGSTTYTWDHVLQAIFALAVTCVNAFALGWTEVEVTATAALVLAVPRSKATTVQVTKRRHHLEFILMAEMLQNVSEFSEVQPKCSGIHVGPLRNDLQCQSEMSNATCVWDPGIKSLFFSCKQLNITELIQIKGWTSMTYSGISSLEYLYTMIFLCDKGEFIDQQGVHKKYNAKHWLLPSYKYIQIWEMVTLIFDQWDFLNQRSVQENHNGKQPLVSSKNCLHIWKFDILFTTFLPP